MLLYSTWFAQLLNVLEFDKNIMKKVFVCFLFVLFCMSVSAQTYSGDKFIVSAELGQGVLFGRSNLSAFGVDYRGEYKKGFSGNVRALFLIDKSWAVGLKYNLFSSSANYALFDGNRVADDVDVQYVAPQFGIRRMINEKFVLSGTLGAGYMHYQSNGIYDGNGEFECTSSSLGVNMDFMLEYRLFKNFAVSGGVSFLGSNGFKKIKVMQDEESETLRPDKWNRIRMLRVDYILGFMVYF